MLSMAEKNRLPSDLQACHALLREQFRLVAEQDEINASLARDNERLKHEIEQLKRYIYGRRSERVAPNDGQLPLFEFATETPVAAEPEPSEREEITYRRRKRQKSDRFPPHLPREVQTIDVPEEQWKCPCCGDEMPIIATDVRERLDFIPAKLIVHELHYPKRACGKCKQGVTVAPPPAANEPAAALTPGSRHGFGVTAQILLAHSVDHIPKYRQEDQFARAGVVIPRSTQVDLVAAAADLIAPLAKRMRERLLDSHGFGLDDTPARMQDASLPGRMRTARMWLARGRAAAPYNVFFFHESRERDGPAKFLEGYQGWVMVDAYGVNNGVYLGDGNILAACCNSHARRKFEAAQSNDPARAARALAFYRELYDIEDRARDFSPEDRWRLRQAESVPVLKRFKQWLAEQSADPRVLPKSAIAVAIRYVLNLWESLTAFANNGLIPFDNNDTERDLRRITIGRKNWLFIGSPAAGQAAATIYSLVASAARHNLDLWVYLDDVLRRLAGGETDLDALLPDHWRATHPEAIRVYRETEKANRAEKTKARRARRRKPPGRG